MADKTEEQKRIEVEIAKERTIWKRIKNWIGDKLFPNFCCFLIAFLFVGCGHGGSVRPPAAPIDVFAAAWHDGDVRICSGSSVVQTFHGEFDLTTGIRSTFNYRPQDAGNHQKDRYIAKADGIYWISSDTVDPAGNLLARQLSTTDYVSAPLILNDGASVSLSSSGSYSWGPCENGNCLYTATGYFTDRNDWSYKGGVLTRHEIYADPTKSGYDLTTTYDQNGLLSVAGFGRCK